MSDFEKVTGTASEFGGAICNRPRSLRNTTSSGDCKSPLRKIATLAVLSFTLFHASATLADDRPNLLFILADDLGWTDIGCYGEEIFETPHLDQLAAEGLRFTQAYSPAPICSASRAGFLTGKTPARLGFEFVTKPEAGYQPMVTPLRAPPFTLDLPLEETIIAETLSDAGYQTAFFGKWHLNQHYQRYLGWSPTHGPKAQGFQVAEEDFGSHPYSYWNDKSKRDFLDLPDGEFVEDSMTQRAIKFLKQDHERPFFLMVSHFYVHDPIHTRVKWLHDHYDDKIPADHPRHDVLAHYGAMVTALDHYVGQLLAALDETGLAENTLVVFTSDNGGHPNYAGNAPLRGSKWNLYEGGIRVPFLARWAGKIAPNETCDTPIIGLDLFPTFTELANAELPPDRDGRSLLPVFENPKAKPEPRDLLWHFPYYHPEKGFAKAPATIGIDDGLTSQTRPHSVLRSGDWKLLHFYESDRDELYRTDEDLTEQHDRLSEDADRGRELRLRLDQLLETSGARLPTPHPDYSEKP
ncbi:MAG: sulfatase [Verrucomicrobiae bacterium]|nr:sulfatase [Verrucomicrobiae bacterium]